MVTMAERPTKAGRFPFSLWPKIECFFYDFLCLVAQHVEVVALVEQQQILSQLQQTPFRCAQ